MTTIRLVLLAIFLFLPIHAQAQDFQYYETLSEINRIDPLQNPRLRPGDELIMSKVKDRKNKVVGVVTDLIVDRQGKLEMMSLNFDEIHLPADIYLSYQQNDIVSYADGYGLSFTQQRIEEIYPELLSGIATASGDVGSDIFSLNTLKGATITSEKGLRLAQVIDVLFNREGNQAKTYYIEIKRQGYQGHRLAIPFESVDIVSTGNAKPDLIVSEARADNIIEYVKD